MATGLLLLGIGLASGAYGIMVGAGGGFIFVPALLILLHLSPEVAAGTGLIVVFVNAAAGLSGYIRQKRIDYKMGIILSIGAVPGTFFGIWGANVSSSQFFSQIFAIMLLALGIFLIIKKAPGEKPQTEEAATLDEGAVAYGDNRFGSKTRLIEFLIGILLGIVSGFFGIGGGFLVVPILIYIFRVAPHRASATSIFSLALYSLVGVGVHLYQGSIDWTAVLWGGVGVLIGAQLGVYLSKKISGKRIVQMLAIILIGVGVKLFF